MLKPCLLVKPSPSATRLLMTFGDSEALRAVLPSPATAHQRAASMLCEALALWMQRPLSVVLCADGQGDSSALGLCDGFGFGNQTELYEVEVVDPTRRRRGLGSFHDLRQLLLPGAR